MQTSLLKRTAAGCGALLLALSLTACMNKEDPASASSAASNAESAAPDESAPVNTMAPDTTTGAPAPTEPRDDSLPMYCWNIADTSIHIREQPNTMCEVIGGYQKGEKATILGKEGDWYKIQILSLVGYVSGQYLSFTDPALGKTTAQGTTAATTAAG